MDKPSKPPLGSGDNRPVSQELGPQTRPFQRERKCPNCGQPLSLVDLEDDEVTVGLQCPNGYTLNAQGQIIALCQDKSWAFRSRNPKVDSGSPPPDPEDEVELVVNTMKTILSDAISMGMTRDDILMAWTLGQRCWEVLQEGHKFPDLSPDPQPILKPTQEAT